MWVLPPVLVEKYIHFPSGDHAASVHCAGAGPTGLPSELPSNGTRRQGSHELSISTASSHFRSGDDAERWAMPFSLSGLYTVRASIRLSVDVTTDICGPWPVISENRTCGGSVGLLIHASPSAFVSNRCGWPPSTGTTHVRKSKLVAFIAAV